MKSTVLALAAGLAGGTLTAAALTGALPLLAQERDANEATYESLELFATVIERVRSQYVHDTDSAELIDAAIKGMLQSLDPHSSLLSQDEYKEMQERTDGEVGGLGMEVTQEDGFIKVIAPMDDTPAAGAGVQAGDLIIQVDGESILGTTLTEGVDLLRGPVGSEVVITIIREGETEPLDLAIVRGAIKVPAARVRLESDAVVARVATFSKQSLDNIQKGLEKSVEEAGGMASVKGMVLDLRNNAGGLLSEAIAVSDAFLDKGEIVTTRGKHSNATDRVHATSGDLMRGKPLIVLINAGSASASEIVAGALQDHGRAIVVGTRSFGKGSVQSLYPLEGQGALKLTTGLYYTPSGRSIQAVGISPDVIVDQLPIAELEREEVPGAYRFESDLRTSLENDSLSEAERQSIEEEIEKREAVVELRSRDYQLAYAIDLLNGLAVAQDR